MVDSATHSYPLVIVRGGPFDGSEFMLGAGPNVVGRGDDAEVRVRSKEVSRRHARLDVRDDGIFVVDLGSKNGVFVDGVRVPVGERGLVIDDGGRVELGDVLLELDDPSARVARALAEGGETTVTRRRPLNRASRGPGLVTPIVAAFVFAVAAYVLWSLD